MAEGDQETMIIASFAQVLESKMREGFKVLAVVMTKDHGEQFQVTALVDASNPVFDRALPDTIQNAVQPFAERVLDRREEKERWASVKSQSERIQ